jgi:hypothetical protein
VTGWQRWWRRGARTLAVLSTLTAVAVATTVPGAAGAAEEGAAGDDVTLPATYLDGYGWWSKAQQSPSGGQGVPAPACEDAETPVTSSECVVGPPPDGLYVAYDYEAVPNQTAVSGPISNAPLPPSPGGAPEPPKVLGPSAYGAVRFVVPDGAETQLTLEFLSKQSSTPGGQDPSVGVVLGCAVTTPGWASIQNGRYDQAPGYDCSSADQADVVGDSLVFDFPARMVQNGILDVAVVGAGDRPFQMAFDKPVDASLAVTNAEELASTTEDVAYEDVVVEDPLLAYDEALTEIPYESDFAGDVAFTTDEAMQPSPAAPVSRPRPEVALPAGRVRNPLGPDATRGQRIMAVGLLLAMGLALWWVGGRPVRGPQLLGSLGAGGAAPVAGDGPDEQQAEPVRGIGRFVRPRSGKPPRLF